MISIEGGYDMKILQGFWFAALLPVIMITSIVSVSNAGSKDTAIRLPKTGQTTCYDSSGNVISCTNTGQDGELQKGVAWPNQRFTANADTTVTDNLTGLVWASNGNLMQTRDSNWKEYETFVGAVAWQHALDYVAKLNAEKYLGHNDWRLPNFKELGSLVNNAQTNTAEWLNNQGFTNVQASNFYWSSTSFSSDAVKAWAVDMVWGNMKYFNKANNHYVWPVRGGQ
jgi:hypothetical protein